MIHKFWHIYPTELMYKIAQTMTFGASTCFFTDNEFIITNVIDDSIA